MPSFSAWLRTRLELESRLCVTSSDEPVARASSIWLESSWDCMDVVTVAAARPRRANAAHVSTMSATATTFRTSAGVMAEAGADVVRLR